MIDELLDAVGVSDVSRVGEMVLLVMGGKSIAIENMLGLLTLDESMIVVKASKHQKVIIEGEMLEVLSLTKNDISIRGRLLSVRYEQL